MRAEGGGKFEYILYHPCIQNHASFKRGGLDESRVSTAVPVSVDLLCWSPFRSDRTWQTRARRRWHLSADLLSYTLELMTRQV